VDRPWFQCRNRHSLVERIGAKCINCPGPFYAKPEMVREIYPGNSMAAHHVLPERSAATLPDDQMRQIGCADITGAGKAQMTTKLAMARLIIVIDFYVADQCNFDARVRALERRPKGFLKPAFQQKLETLYRDPGARVKLERLRDLDPDTWAEIQRHLDTRKAFVVGLKTALSEDNFDN